MPDDQQSSATRPFIAASLTCLVGWACTYLATNVFKDYALGLFIWLPVVMGMSSTILLAHKNTAATKRACRNTSFWTLLIFCGGLLVFALEGVICIVMAAPIGLFFNWIGFMIGWEMVRKKLAGDPPTALIIMVLSIPALMGFEYATNGNDGPVKPIVTAIEINAPAETVWKNVIEFPQLEEPSELVFKTGIAYPVNAKIEGNGVGALRHCNFSTGSFVEPVTVWDEPRLLKFDVLDQPEPMKEWSPYDLHPNHLHGYFVSKQGQFRLVSLPNGHTLLEGTTWYSNRIQPAIYWDFWSDFIVHKIHERVLRHIKAESEKGAG